jgi:alpha-L-rhamnosidase
METQPPGAAHISITNLRAEYLENPLGIDERQPVLSWQLAAGERSILQSAYQVQAALLLNNLARGVYLLWDSGKVSSDRSVSVPYQGPALPSGQRCYWRARAWDQHGRPSGWSEPAWWEMGLLEEQDWTAGWIEADWKEDPKVSQPCPFFRRGFTLDQGISSARLYVTAHGLYEAWLNGQRVGDQVFTPGYTPYDLRLQYQAYDVTALLQKGENALGAILGDGWYRGKVYVFGSRNVYGTRLGLLAQLVIKTDTGSRIVIGSGPGWKAATGPILKSDMKDGEVYDARLEMPGWCSPGFDDSAWKEARAVQHPKNHLAASLGAPVRRKETFRPVVLKTPNGETVLDFGQNLAGVVRFKVRGAKGTTVRLRHGEALDKRGNFTLANVVMGNPASVEKKPFQEVRYTLKGEGVEEYEPRFTVHGFRYVQLAGYPGEPDPQDFQAVAIYSDMPPTGTFACSDLLINRLHENVAWSMKGNFLDLPTDCPQRERAGWTGDAQIFAPSASFLMDTRAFFSKWLKDLSLEQFPNGMLGNFVPNPYRRLNDTASSFFKRLDGSSGWGDAAVFIPWAFYSAYGDARILERQYPSMKAWVDYQATQIRRVRWTRKLNPRYWLDGGYRARQRLTWDTGYHWGEWLEPADALGGGVVRGILLGYPAVATAYVVQSARILAQAAGLLGKAEDAKKYQELSERVKAAYAAEFIGRDGRMRPDKQASYVRALAFDLAPADLKPAIVERLVRLIRAAGNHVGTGFLSTVYLCEALAENGRLDVAYDLLTQKTAPSWLYAVTKGATTIWETWEGIKEDGTPSASLNHYSPGAVVNFLHRVVAGIKPMEPGYRRILIQPRPGGGLASASATYQSGYGRIACAWSATDGRMAVDVTIPANTRAAVILPGAALEDVLESGVPLLETEGVLQLAQAGPDTQVALGSGEYHFEYPVLT